MNGKRAKQIRRAAETLAATPDFERAYNGTTMVYRQTKRLIRGRKRLAVIRALNGE